MKSNFYINSLIRTLKEFDLYNEKYKTRLDEKIHTSILTYEFISAPHTIIDSLIFNLKSLEQNRIKKFYLNLIKIHYINDIINVINKFHNDNIIIDTNLLWDEIERNFLFKHLNECYNISRDKLKKRKFEFFYKELL